MFVNSSSLSQIPNREVDDMSLDRESIVSFALRVISENLGIQQPLALELAQRVANYMLDKAIIPTVKTVYETLSKIMSEQSIGQDGILSPDELIERANKESAKVAGLQVAKEHIDLFMKIRSEFKVGNDELLLSSSIHGVSNIPDQIRQQIADLQAKFGKIINAVAVHIEEKKYESAESAIADMHSRGRVSGSQGSIMQKLIDADKTLHISCQSLKVTVDFFADLNDHIVQELENCTDSDQEYRLVLGNAILIYELSDYVIRYLKSFKTRGISDIQVVKNEIDKKMDKVNSEIKELREKAQRDEIFPKLKENILSNVSEREKAVKIMADAWTEYLEEIKTLSDETSDFTGKWLPNLELIRDDARNQISALDVLTIVKVLRSNLMDLESAVKSLKDIPLVSLSPDRVRRLLGI